MARLARHLVMALGGLADKPDQPISMLPLSSGAERLEIRARGSGPLRPWSGAAALDRLFADQASRRPKALALRTDDGDMTYAELADRAAAFTQALGSAGVGAGAVVAIELPRSADAVAAMLAVASIAATWVCVDPEHPAELLAYMFADSQAAALVTSRARARQRRPADPTTVIPVEDVGDAPPHAAGRASARGASPTCLIYTSGSTGRPKAVMAEPAAISNRLAWMWHDFPFGPDDVMVHKTALGFVDAIWEIMGPLLAGVPSVIIPEQAARDPVELIDRLAAARATRVLIVPSQLQAVLDCGREVGLELPALRTWFTSGEALPADVARRFHQFVPHGRLVNLYGSSEVAGDVSCAVRTAAAGDAPVTIGRPIANTALHLLDEHGRPAAVGVPGRLFVGGANVARGYWRRPRLTAERFVPDPFSSVPGARIYDTGDRARWREQGELEFIGRADRQIKLRGHRIELDGVEQVLLGHGDVRAAVAAPVETSGGDQLVAFVVGTAHSADLLAHARRHLAASMVPDRFVLVDELPRRPNGKIDRSALAPFCGDAVPRLEHVAPRSDVERKVADMWRELLHVERVSMTDNFFDVGGHSLLATRLVSSIRQHFAIALPLRAIFEHPSAGELAALIAARLAGDDSSREPVAADG